MAPVRDGLRDLTDCERVLTLLRRREGEWVADLYKWAGCMVHSRVAELRRRGHQIECRRFGSGDYRYRLVEGKGARVKTILIVGFLTLLLAGCGSIYLKHPATGGVVECNGPGIVLVKVIVTETCRARWEDRGYAVVEKCKDAAPGASCVTEEERDRAQ